MPQPIRAYTNAAGESYLQLENGHKIRLPAMGGGTDGGGSGPPAEVVVPNEVTISATQPTDGSELWLDTSEEAGVPDGGISQADADLRYVNVTGDTMTGDLQIRSDAATSSRVILNSAAGKYAGPVMQTDGKPRWWLYKGTMPESGANVGSDLRLSRYDDAGTHIGIPIEVSRATGVVTFEKQPVIAAAQSEADIAMSSGWGHYGGSFGNCKVTRNGSGVILQGLPKRTADLTPVVGTYYPVGTVPAGFRPDVLVYDDSYYNGGTVIVRVQVDLAGVVSIAFMSTNPIVSGGWCPLNTSWRAA